MLIKNVVAQVAVNGWDSRVEAMNAIQIIEQALLLKNEELKSEPGAVVGSDNGNDSKSSEAEIEPSSEKQSDND